MDNRNSPSIAEKVNAKHLSQPTAKSYSLRSAWLQRITNSLSDTIYVVYHELRDEIRFTQAIMEISDFRWIGILYVDFIL